MEKYPRYLVEKETSVKRTSSELASNKAPWTTPNITKIGESDVNGAKGMKGMESSSPADMGPS